MFIRDFAVSIAVGTILLLSLSRLIGRVQFSLSTAFWCSFIGHSFVSLMGLLTGFVFSRQLGIGLLVAVAIGFVFQAVLFQIPARAQSETLIGWRAATLSFIVILGDFFVASPLIKLWE
jgi:NhaP-type Na+/H+ or K+/H+ antiporter